MTLFLCGDVMIGRGIDQILAHPSDPVLYEDWIRSAEAYVALAEGATGPIPRGVDARYVWGDALPILAGADARIVNLETAVTTSPTPWPKGIHYRMHPANVGCLTAARIDVCGLANNHVLDWGRPGLVETLATLHAAGLGTAGAGRDAEEAAAPAVLNLPGGRVLVFAVGHPSSGIPPEWAATVDPGVSVVDVDDPAPLVDRVRHWRRPGDLVVVSIHWGGNWGYAIPPAHRTFAHALVDDAGVDVVHGHSSHHPIGVEFRRGRPILYGCGDFLNDYEGIGGYEAFRPELTCGYLVSAGRLELIPFRLRHFRLERAEGEDLAWLARTLARASRDARVQLGSDCLFVG